VDEGEENEVDEEEEEQVYKRQHVTTRPAKEKLSTPEYLPKKAKSIAEATVPSLFGCAWEISHPEIKEHFIMLPCPSQCASE
jgi:hypothetical protein